MGSGAEPESWNGAFSARSSEGKVQAWKLSNDRLLLSSLYECHRLDCIFAVLVC